MKTITFAFLILAANALFAGNLKIQESLIGKTFSIDSRTVLDDARKSHEELCNFWKADKPMGKSAKVMYSTCGSRKDRTLSTYHFTMDPNIGTVKEDGPAYGYVSYSVAQIAFDVEERSAQAVSEWIESAKYSCADYKDKGKCLEAIQKAQADYVAKCKEFKADAKKQLGDKLVFASCGLNVGDLQPTNVKSNDFVFQFKSEGTVYYLN